MKIKYKGSRYKVSFIDGIKIQKRILLLKMRRIKRWGERIGDIVKKDLIFLFVLIILYTVILCVLGTKFFKRTIIDCVWESKAEIFTVFIVVALTEIINRERQWRQTIRKWHDVYVDSMYEFEYYIKDLLKYTGISINDDNFLYTRSLFERFDKEVREKEMDDSNIRKSNVLKTLDRITITTRELNKEVSENEFLYEKDSFKFEYKDLMKHIENLKDLIEEDKLEIKDELLFIFYFMYKIISIIRKRWRTEINLDREIIEILKNDNEEIIINDYYLNALSYKEKEER